MPYCLPSGRTVRLRGKWDSIDLVSRKSHGIWVRDHKTKGDIKESLIRQQLTFDLQTMLYVVAFQVGGRDHLVREMGNPPVKGVRYNVVRRPLSGGKGSIRQRQGEYATDFFNRLAAVIEEDPGNFFMRWDVPLHPSDVTRFCRQSLNPILERLCTWWEWISRYAGSDPFTGPEGQEVHYRHPYGVYNPLDEGGQSDLDEYLATGSTVGLSRVEELFPELA